jgi:hypothetical protein
MTFNTAHYLSYQHGNNDVHLSTNKIIFLIAWKFWPSQAAVKLFCPEELSIQPAL